MTYVPHVRIERADAGPEVVVGYNVRMSDPHSVRLLVERLQNILALEVKDNRWIQHD